MDNPNNHPDGSFMRAAEDQVNRLIKANRVNRIVIGVVACLVVLLLGVSAFLGINLYKTSQLSQGVRQSAIQACHNGNNARATDKLVFDSLIDTSISTNTGILKDPGFIKWKQSIDSMPSGPDKDSMKALYNLQVKIVQPKSSALKQIEDFKAYIAKQYAPIDCTKLYAVHEASGKR